MNKLLTKNAQSARRLAQKGFTLLEVMLASSIMTVVIAGAVSVQNYTQQRNTSNNDKAFASQKAMQMFEELRAYVQANRETDISKLQNFSDGSSFNHVLTTEKKDKSSGVGVIAVGIENPGDALSGNTRLDRGNGGAGSLWKYVRQIQVKPIPNDLNARYVTISVWHADRTNNTQPASAVPLATISGILKTNISQDTPTQMYDLFIIAAENAPSWWVDLADLKPSFERTLSDLEQRNPGLVFRRHFISRFGFGRDPYYMPYINSQATANSQDLPFAYFYPGRIQHSTLLESYVLEGIQGRRRSDNNDILSLNKPSYGVNTPYRYYPLSDQFNHVMRYPEQKAMEERLVRQDPNNFKDNPSLVTFLEELNNSDKYKNAIIVNLHGELLPLPAIRNYSDAAKAPDLFARKLNAPDPNNNDTTGLSHTAVSTQFTSLQYKRVVSHPENLRYNNRDSVSWRVYAYEQLPPGTSSLPNTADEEEDSIPEISMFIPTIGKGPAYSGAINLGHLNYPDFTPSNPASALQIRKMVGSDNKDYAWWGETGATGIKKIVNTHDFAQTGGLPNSNATFINNNVAASSVPTSGAVTGSNIVDLAASLNTTDAADLINTLIVFDGGTSNEEIVRVTSVQNAGSGTSNQRRRLVLNRNLTRNHNTPLTVFGNTFRLGGSASVAPITKHRDYSAEVVNDTMFGHTHRGIRVKLYDTRARAPFNTSTGRGLRDDRRLDGLEYIPAPIGTTNGTSFASGDDLTDNTPSDFKNTARWRVTLNTGNFGSDFDNQMVTLETRMVPARSSYPTGCNANLNELCDGLWGDGDTYVPNFTESSNENQVQQRENLYNVSRTYTYMNHIFTDVSDTSILGATASIASVIPNNARVIPKVEQFQYLGDPRLNPYLDVKRLHRYNRHFEAINGGGSGIAGFDRATGRSWDRDDLDLNWYFNLYSNGLMRSNAIYNSITGYSNYYYAHGGELGSDGNSAVFPIRSQPWNSTDTGTSSVNNDNNSIREIIENGSRVIMSTNGSTSTRWRMHNYNNELFPDDEIAFWRANGNLPTLDYNNGLHNANPSVGAPARSYFRATSDSDPRRRPSSNSYRRISTTGAPSFLNGNSTNNPAGSNNGLQHVSVDGDALLTNGNGDAGKQLVEAFNLILSDNLPSNRPFILNSSGTSGGYSTPELRDLRNRLSFINSTTGAISSTSSTQNVYYRHNSDINNRVGSAIIKMTRPNPSSPTNSNNDLSGLVGYVLMNGLQETNTTGVQDLARFTQAGSLQTYMDAGDRNIPGRAAGRTVQLPRVRINSPRSSEIQDNPSTIPVEFNVAWLRWDDRKYSPAYPNNWYDETRLQYNIKYSKDNKASWLYAGTNVDVGKNAGLYFLDHFNSVYSAAGGPETVTGSRDKTFNWNVSSLPEGNYVLRIEVYREGFDTGYSYHDVFVTIER